MTDNEKLARWQGKISNQINLFVNTPTGFWPDYLNDDSAAMSLLDTLVEKGLTYTLYPELHNNKVFGCCIWNQDNCKWANPLAESVDKPTRREAVVAAVLELIEKENLRDQTK